MGLPHDEDGERPLAFVVLSERKEVSTDELMVYVNGGFQFYLGYWDGLFVVFFQIKLWTKKNYAVGSASLRKFHEMNWAK